jgi:hypothetical protein
VYAKRNLRYSECGLYAMLGSESFMGNMNMKCMRHEFIVGNKRGGSSLRANDITGSRPSPRVQAATRVR